MVLNVIYSALGQSYLILLQADISLMVLQKMNYFKETMIVIFQV
jgi:hypothetical protein